VRAEGDRNGERHWLCHVLKTAGVKSRAIRQSELTPVSLLLLALAHARKPPSCCVDVGLGLVRRIQLSPASPPVLSGATEAALSGGATARGGGVERMRAAVLFGSGQVNVYDLDAVGRIRPGGVVSAAAASRLGAVRDIGWLSLPS